MKRIHTSPDPVLGGWLASILESADIPCLLRNGYLGGGAGELPVNECWPELWVLHDADEARARRLVDAATTAPAPSGSPWRCASCGESNETSFGSCWQCGAEPSSAASRRG